MPRSLWQCTEKIALSEFGTRARTVSNMAWYSCGVVYPTVSGRLIVVAPALIAASTIRHMKSISVRVASSADHSTSSVHLRARVTASMVACKTCSGVMPSLTDMCSGEVEMNVWMRPRLAGLIAAPQRSMSASPVRDRPQITDLSERRAISATDSKSPSEAAGKPASIMSTPISSSNSATSSFSSNVMVAPGHCSPSRKVVSKMKTRSLLEPVSVAAVIVLVLESNFSVEAGATLSKISGGRRVGFSSSPQRPGKAQPALRGG